jgi:hypothetical protein
MYSAASFDLLVVKSKVPTPSMRIIARSSRGLSPPQADSARADTDR